MKRIGLVFSVALAAGSMLFGARAALADDCARLGGVINAVPECVVSTAVSRSNLTAPGGPYTLDETLRITSTGSITIPKVLTGNTLTINLTGPGDGLIMEVGAKIIGDNGASPNASNAVAATITINALGDGNFLLAGDGTNGALISSEQQAGSCNGGRGGNITLTSNGGNIDTEDGSVISANANKCPAGEIIITTSGKGLVDIDGSVLSQSGATGTGGKGGGPITIKAGCDLLISDTGVVSSKGLDPGADLVHIEACAVRILGLVESTGHGHAKPTAGNRCNADNVVAHPLGTRSTFFSGCVEVWSGTTITILNDGAGNEGEINADIPGPGGNNGRGWIDLFARGDISITGNAKYAVHSNGGLFQNTDDGGVITVKSSGGQVLTAALAIQANSTSAGGLGGDVIVEASQNIEFGTASIQAKGASGGVGAGGHITAQSYHGAINGAAPGELNAFPAASGTVKLTACTGVGGPLVTYAGVVTGVETDIVSCPAGDPVIPAGVPLGTCTDVCDSDGNEPCEKATVTSVLNPLTGRFPGNLGPDVIVRLDLGQVVSAAVSAATDVNGDGYIIVLVVKDGTGILGGSTSDNVVISLAYPKRFALLACSVTIKALDTNLPAGRVTTTASSPVGSPENIFVMDLHGANSKVAGWLVEGNGRYFRNVANNNNAIGIAFIGNGNTMHNGNGTDNDGAGIYVQGNSNTVDSSDAFGNGGNGVTVVGGSNKILKVDAGDKGKGNTGDGVNVAGNGNTIQEVDGYANGGNGIAVSGNSNKLLKNNVGDRNKSNAKDGILLTGNSNTVQENDAYANGGNGIKATGAGNTFSKNTAGDRGDKANGGAGFLLSGGSSLTENEAIGNLGDGFRLLTSGFSLSKNVSGGTGSGQPNALCQYRFDVAGNVNAGSNKSNNVTLAGSPFTAGCK